MTLEELHAAHHDTLKYAVALQRAVELWYHGQPIPREVASLCSYHAGLLSEGKQAQ